MRYLEPPRADSPREVDEAERPGWMRGPCDQGAARLKGHVTKKSPKISSYFSLFGCLRGGSAEREDPGRRSRIFQNIYMSRAVLQY